MSKVVNHLENADKVSRDYKNLTSKRAKALGKWVKSNGEYRSADLTTTDNGALITPDIIQSAIDLSARKFQLKPLVNTINVSKGIGEVPYIDPNSQLKPKEELAKDNDVDSSLSNISYKCTTMLGRLNLSQEYIQDSNANILPLLTREMGTTLVNTQNAAIMKKLSSLPTTNISTDNLDDLINAIESIDPRFQSNIFVGQSAYAKLRTMKDKNNRYLLNENTNTLLGIPVTVIPNYCIDNPNDIFVGDLKDSVLFLDRLNASLSYNRPGIYGEGLIMATRFDVQLVDPDETIKHLTFGGSSK